MTILIIGAGEIGKALAHVLRRHSIVLWDKNSSVVPGQPPLSDAIHKADIIFIAVPSFANRDVAKMICKYAKADHPKLVISVSKGMEKDTGKLMSEVLREELHPRLSALSSSSAFIGVSYGLLMGPMIAEDLMKDKPTTAVLALSDERLRPLANRIFEESIIKTVPSKHLTSVALASVLKNIYSIGLGAAYARGESNNELDILRSDVLVEMKKIIYKLEGNPNIVDSPAGKDDFWATSSTQNSSNFHTGELLVKNISPTKPSEGIVSIQPIVKKLGNDITDYPILNNVYNLIRGK